jgi:two-component system, chemotaxis family, CheB/CheR fusion protein
MQNSRSWKIRWLLPNESVVFKQNFLANMSHEIRTPLTGIMGMTDILISHTEVSPKQMEYLNILRSSGENLKGDHQSGT